MLPVPDPAFLILLEGGERFYTAFSARDARLCGMPWIIQRKSLSAGCPVNSIHYAGVPWVSERRDLASGGAPPNQENWMALHNIRAKILLAENDSLTPAGGSLCRRSGPALGSLAVGLRDLPDEFRPGHVYGAVDGTSLRACVVFQDLDHQGRVVRDDHPSL